MKISDLLESKLILEAYNFGKMQQHVYDFVLKKMKSQKFDHSHALMMAHESDQFWVSQFDSLDREISRKDRYIETILDSLAEVVSAVSESVVEFFGNPMNHPPGFKTSKLIPIEYESLRDKDLIPLLNLIDPSIIEAVKKEEQAAMERRKAAAVAAKATITKERMQEVADHVKKHSSAGWKKFFNVFKKDKKPLDYFPKGVKEEDLASLKSVDDLKEFFKKLGAKAYIGAEAENLFNLDLTDQESALNSSLGIIARDTGLSNKLFKMVA